MTRSALRTAIALTGLSALCASASAAPHWIWAATPAADDVVCFRHEFQLAKAPDRAVLRVTADNSCEVFLNGRSIGRHGRWEELAQFEVTAALTAGRNVLAIRATNGGDAAGMIAELRFAMAGADGVIESGPAWKCLRRAPAGWMQPEFVITDAWQAAADIGELGKAGPWGNRVQLSANVQTIAARRTLPVDGPFELKDGDTVVLLGDTFIERDYNYGFLESSLTAAWPDRKIKFRNLGWSGDTPRCEARSYFGKPEEGFDRLRKTLEEIKPSVVICCYGAVDAFNGESATQEFSGSCGRLLDMIEDATGAGVVLLGPPPSNVSPAHQEGVARVRNALSALAKERRLRFGALDGIAAGPPEQAFVNGVTLTESGYAMVASGFLEALGVDGQTAARGRAASRELRSAVVAKNRLFFHRWRPENETYLFGFRKHEQGRNGAEIPLFDPLVEAREKEIAALLKQGPL